MYAISHIYLEYLKQNINLHIHKDLIMEIEISRQLLRWKSQIEMILKMGRNAFLQSKHIFEDLSKSAISHKNALIEVILLIYGFVFTTMVSRLLAKAMRQQSWNTLDGIDSRQNYNFAVYLQFQHIAKQKCGKLIYLFCKSAGVEAQFESNNNTSNIFFNFPSP